MNFSSSLINVFFPACSINGVFTEGPSGWFRYWPDGQKSPKSTDDIQHLVLLWLLLHRMIFFKRRKVITDVKSE